MRSVEHLSCVESSLAAWRVLVADDEPSVLASVRRYFERLGATVAVASDGSEAEAHLRAGHFDLALLDVTMPNGGGYDVIPAARDSATRVILMSGYAEHERTGPEPDAYLEKPFTQKVLDQVVRKLTERKLTGT